MAKYRHALSQSQGRFFLTDGGIETTLIFLDGQELPYFAAFHLLKTQSGEESLRNYFRTYAELARTHRSGLDDSTSAYPSYFMINCAYTTHFSSVVAGGGAWTSRIRGLRANASTMSHAQLNDAAELDAGNPEALGRDYAALKKDKLKYLNVFGGCCGTDHRHVHQMALACRPLFGDAT